MKNLFRLAFLIFITNTQLRGQTLTDSNLPIVIISTNAQIPDEPKILGTMKIIFAGEGQRNYVNKQNDPSVLNYNGRIGIEIRGSSSQFLEKKQYSLTTLLADNTTNNNVSLLGMPKENDWVLNGLAFDASLMRDYLSYTLSRKIGDYAPRTKYCEVIINNDYRGIYILQEKIKADDHRVDVIKISPTDNTLPDLSGGYITKCDKVAGSDVPSWSLSSYLGMNDVNFIHEMPKPSAITPQQNDYIRWRFLSLSSKASNPSVTDGFPSIIDVPSFVDFMLLNELAANVDAYQFSTFFHKDKNGKLRAGPLWDLNLTFGNDLFLWNLDRSKTSTWQFDNGDNVGARFWKDLFDNSTFKCYMSKRWNELTQTGAPLHIDSIKALIDKTAATLIEASGREFGKWQTEKSQWRAPLDEPTQVNNLKAFLDARMAWMSNNLGSFSNCSNVQTPPLVITRIMYQPDSTSAFPDSKDQEFIEIVNNGNEPVKTTGLYFSGTGFVYQFPNNFSFPPHAAVQLANKHETFLQRYGFSPFGEFTRNLSNDGKKLTLADGYGNVIDEVEYSSAAPWPDAAGNGLYLKLISADLDNTVASNWIASDDPISTTITAIEEHSVSEVLIYPNPVESILRITSPYTITSVQFRDIQGRLLETFHSDSNAVTLNVSNFAQGLYMITVMTNGRTLIQKVVKR